MASCNLGPSFPTWLKFQKKLLILDLSNASISSSLPNWLWNISSPLEHLDLSSNQLQGQLPKQLRIASLSVIDLSSNHFEGPIPLPYSGCSVLDLSNNIISGPIPPNIGQSIPNMAVLSLSDDQITGIIPKSIGYMRKLIKIDLSRNSLTGSIPSSISNCSSLFVLNLGQNNLPGAIPNSFAQLTRLQLLHLNRNKLSGGLPLSFQNLSCVEILDLSYNKLSGDIPAWIGTAFSSLRILKLSSNAFSVVGGLVFGLSNLDLSENNCCGSIPSTLGNLKAMCQKPNISNQHRESLTNLFYQDYFDLDKMIVKAKGQDLEYAKFLSLIVNIDLSSNNFIGEFQDENAKVESLNFVDVHLLLNAKVMT